MDTSPQPLSENRPANRLSDATSPYLLQHAHNPVDWYPWGAEAIEKAQRENKPIFLSIGYSACHWCHVMEREVFENESLAKVLNEHFVSIKVDREERPDLDDLYMLATQVSTGSGGWPMSLWLTPQLEPFYAGTYIPPQDMMGRPGFGRVCEVLAEAWRTQPETLRQQARQIVEAVRQYADETGQAETKEKEEIPVANWLLTTLQSHTDRFDPEHGGLGAAPKFPPSQALLLWLELLKPPTQGMQVLVLNTVQLDRVRRMLTTTLDAMMRGGIYDQIGGGFARYSTDEKWRVPHFEKMLYDNAQLATAYAFAAHLLHRPDYERIARQTLDFCLNQMLSKDGGFYSAFDADSEGREGQYYLWTIEQIQAALPNPDDAKLIVEHFGLTTEGNFSHEGGAGANILYVAKTVEQLAPAGTSPEAMQKRIDQLCLKLRNVRAQRVPPTLDNKILTAWNGLMISALAIAGRLFREPRYLEAAHRTMGYILLHHMERGRHLLRLSRPLPPPPNAPLKVSIKTGGRAFLEDHATILNGLLDLIDSTSPMSLPGTMARKRAPELADNMIRLFHDPEQGGFFFTSAQQEMLWARIKNAGDGSTPSANGMALRALLRLAQVSGKLQYRDLAQDAVRAFASAIKRQPAGFATIILGLVEDQTFLASPQYLQQPAAVPAPLPPSPAVTVETAPFAPQGILTLDEVLLPAVRPGDSFEIPLTLHIAPGYHIQLRHPANPEAYATVVRLRGDVPLTSYDWQFPSPQKIVAGNTTLSGYESTIVFRGRATVQGGVKAGRYTLRATILAQPCQATSCLPPERLTLEIPLVIS